MKKLLYKMMEYRFIYRLMPKWMKFIYSFDIMAKNKSGSLHLDNGYSLNFETMKIEDESDNPDTAQKEMIDLVGKLNHFCFHGSGADDNCHGCCFEGEVPCPLAVFHDKLVGKL